VTFFTPRFSRHRNCTVAVAWRPSRPEEKIIEPQAFRAMAAWGSQAEGIPCLIWISNNRLKLNRLFDPMQGGNFENLAVFQETFHGTPGRILPVGHIS
jgi:hypothetical protein